MGLVTTTAPAYDIGNNKSFLDYQNQAKEIALKQMLATAQVTSEIQNAQRNQALLEETVRSNKAKEYNEGGGMMGNPYLNSPDAGGINNNTNIPTSITSFDPTKLESYPVQMQPILKGLIDGSIAPTRQSLGTNPQLYITAAKNIDNNFDAVNYGARNKVYQSFTSGKDRQTINSIETALNTLSQLKDSSDKLGGTNNAGILNQPINYLNSEYLASRNDPNLNTYDTKAKAAADEVVKAIIPGGGTIEDRQKRSNTLRSGQSPESRTAGQQALIDELSARLEPLAQSYNQGMGTSKEGIDLLSPSAVTAYNKIMGKAPSNAHASGVKVIQDATPIDVNEIPAGSAVPPEPPINPIQDASNPQLVQNFGLAKAKFDASKGNAPTITTQAEFDKLPSGATYISTNGQPHRKP